MSDDVLRVKSPPIRVELLSGGTEHFRPFRVTNRPLRDNVWRDEPCPLRCGRETDYPFDCDHCDGDGRTLEPADAEGAER